LRERHAFPQGNPQKVQSFRELSCGKFKYTAESKKINFKEPITTSEVILEKINPWVSSTTLQYLEEKMEKHGITENNNSTFSR
jgi:hypothetical protein